MAALADSSRAAGPWVAAAGQTDFPVPYPLVDLAGLTVTRTRGGIAAPLVVGADVSAIGMTDASFTMRLAAPSLAGDVIATRSRLPNVRKVALQPGGAVRTDVLEADATRTAAVQQELRRDLDGLAFAFADTVAGLHDDGAWAAQAAVFIDDGAWG